MTLITDDMKTEWFPEDVKPVHPGVYEVETVNGTLNIYYCNFTLDRGWSDCSPDPSVAAQRSWRGIVATRAWRGLKVPHDGKAS